MSMADKIIANAAEHVDAGEAVQAGFAGQTTIANRVGDGGYRVVIATDRRFLVFQSGSFSQTKLKQLIEESPRDQRLGEPTGLFASVTVGSQTMKVNRRYFEQVRATDAALT